MIDRRWIAVFASIPGLIGITVLWHGQLIFDQVLVGGTIMWLFAFHIGYCEGKEVGEIELAGYLWENDLVKEPDQSSK